MFDSLPTRMPLLVAAVVAAALLAPGSTVAQARSAPDSAVSTQQAAVSQRPVLSSAFGEARSRVEGTYGRAGTVRG